MEETVLNKTIPEHLVLYDGNCGLCDQSIQKIILADQKKIFFFASLQSPLGKSLVEQLHLGQIDSVVYVSFGQKAWVKSEAFFKIIKNLPKYKWLNIFTFIPKKWVNFLYDYIAKNRIKWFGNSEQCLWKTPEISKRFLD